MESPGNWARGLRVLEVGDGLPGALVGMILADYGAEVVKLEPPDGDPLRKLPAFQMWNRGKQSWVAELGDPEAKLQVRALAAGADVIVVTGPASRMRAEGLDYGSLSDVNPGVVSASITAFGPDGPYADYPVSEGVVTAKAGRMLEFGCMRGGERPVYSAVPIASYGASQLALHGILAALHQREETGLGQDVRTSLVQALTVYELVNWLPNVPMSLRTDDIPYLPYFVGRSRDGVWVQFAQLSMRQFQALLRNLELLDVYEDPRFKTAPVLADPEHMRALRRILLERFAQRSHGEWMEIFEKDPDMAAERFRTTAEAFSHPQMEYNGILEREDPRLGRTRQLAPLVEFKDHPTPLPGPAPELGSRTEPRWEHTRALPHVREDSTREGRVLEGVTILELATWVAAPFAATLLADLGARVIKIEPLAGEPFRQVMNGLPSTKTVMGKESLAIDLKAPGAREIVHKLVERADLLIHNYRPGVPERLGIDYATLRAINPKLIYLYGASYGSSGPCAAKPAYHPSAGAVCGGALRQAGGQVLPDADAVLDAAQLAHWSRYLELANETNPDPNAAVAAASAALMALYHRARTGQGMALETSMLRSNAYTNSVDFIDYVGRPPRAELDPDLRGLSAQYQLYPTHDGWVFLSCNTQAEFESLCRALGRQNWLHEPFFATPEARQANAALLQQELEAVLKVRDCEELERELIAHGIGCARADRGPFGAFMYDDPAMTEAGFVVKVRSAQWGEHRRYGPTVNLSRDSGDLRGSNVAGAESAQILRELGFGPEQIAELATNAVIHDPALSERGYRESGM